MKIDNKKKLSSLPAVEEAGLESEICRVLALEKEPVDVLFLSDRATWLLDRGILPKSQTMRVFWEITDKIFHVAYSEIRDRILEEERRIPSQQEILAEAVEQFFKKKKG